MISVLNVPLMLKLLQFIIMILLIYLEKESLEKCLPGIDNIKMGQVFIINIIKSETI